MDIKNQNVVQYITLRLDAMYVHLDPWECFLMIHQAAHRRAVPSSLLELMDAKDLGYAWQLTFQVHTAVEHAARRHRSYRRNVPDHRRVS